MRTYTCNEPWCRQWQSASGKVWLDDAGNDEELPGKHIPSDRYPIAVIIEDVARSG